jgi:nucleoside-diphosphate-sugar epimerase
LNLGTDYLVSINELVDTVARVAGKTIQKRYNLTAPQGVRGRNSDNTKLREVLGWEPTTTLEEGLGTTYEWIRSEMAKQPETYLLGAPKPQTSKRGLASVA